MVIFLEIIEALRRCIPSRKRNSDLYNTNNIRLLKIDKPQLNTEMLNVEVIHT